MALTDTEHDLDEDRLDADEAQVGTVAAFLREKRAAIVRDGPAELTLDVPGYDGALVVVYRYPEAGSDEIIGAVQRAQSTTEKDAVVRANADLLVTSCHEILGRVPGGELEPIEQDPEEGRLRFGRRLAELLQIDVPDEVKHVSRYVCRQVFSPQAAQTGTYDGDLALCTQGGRVIAFLARTEEEVSERFVGE